MRPSARLPLPTLALACLLPFAASAQLSFEGGAHRLEDRDSQWSVSYGAMMHLSGHVDETFRAYYKATGQDSKQALAESYDLKDFGVDAPYETFGIHFRKQADLFAFRWDLLWLSLDADAVARRDYYIGVGEDISYGGHKYDHMKIPAGSKFSAEFRGVFTDLVGSFTPFTLQLGEETWLTPSLDLGLVAILGQYEVDAGHARGTAVYQNPPVDFVVGGSADSFVGVPAPRIGAGAELRVGPDDWVQWVFRAGFGYFAYDGGTGVFAHGGSREKNIDVSMLTLAFEAEVLLPMDDSSCFSVGARLEYLHLDGSVASKEKSDAEIIAARERFDKSFDFKSWSAILYVGFAY